MSDDRFLQRHLAPRGARPQVPADDLWRRVQSDLERRARSSRPRSALRVLAATALAASIVLVAITYRRRGLASPSASDAIIATRVTLAAIDTETARLRATRANDGRVRAEIEYLARVRARVSAGLETTQPR